MTSKSKIAWISGSVGIAVVLSGIGIGSFAIQQHSQSNGMTNFKTSATQPIAPVHSTPNHSQAVVPIQAKLTSAIYTHLSNYRQRIHAVVRLPIPVDGENVIYISPASGYAIAQFHQVWSHINKPTVVWLNTTALQAKADWSALGYTSDPLPSAITRYVSQLIPEPDAYHHTPSKGWVELPGILKPSQTHDWIKFFAN